MVTLPQASMALAACSIAARLQTCSVQRLAEVAWLQPMAGAPGL